MIGKGRYRLLKLINQTNSLKLSAEKLGIANKTAYNYIKKIESKLGKPIIISHKGGPQAGGSTELNDTGKLLMKRYEELERRMR